MGSPIPMLVVDSGSTADAPQGSVPVGIYGVSIEAPRDEIVSPSGESNAKVEDRGLFKVEVKTGSGAGILRVEDIGGNLSALLTNEDNNPLSTSWTPSGIVVHQDLDIRIPKAPLSGDFILKSRDGVVSWVADTP